MFCGETCTSVHSVNSVHVHRLRCRTWGCEDCFDLRLRELRDLAASGYPTHMITLTASSRAFDSPDDMAPTLVHAWRMVIQRGVREGRFSRPAYLAVFEDHKSGFPHLHILWRGPNIDHAWLSERMAEYAQGPNVWISKIKNQRVASRYVAKYISKGPARYPGCKRYWRTRSFQLDPTTWEKRESVHPTPCYFHPRSPESLADTYERVGWTVSWSSWWEFDATPYEPGQPAPWLDAYIWQGPPGRNLKRA